MITKHWEANIKGHIVTASTLKELAIKLNIKPSLIEGVYYRSRLDDKIKIRKIINNENIFTNNDVIINELGEFVVLFK